ncbi:hypothetical protein SDC9_92108 [bioreactor metagenome]|uniref:Uncharacterized protein n=1 Tax=bioreactor metagenome TaxID=1076179 RepID=A0A644ZZM4_9ZZZZ
MCGPVEAQIHLVIVLRQDLDVGDRPVVSRVRCGRTGAVGLDAEHPVFQPLLVRVVDQ